MRLFIRRRHEAYKRMAAGPAETKQVPSFDWRYCISN